MTLGKFEESAIPCKLWNNFEEILGDVGKYLRESLKRSEETPEY